MSVRLPDWLFRPLDRVVTAQRRIRRAESDERARARTTPHFGPTTRSGVAGTPPEREAAP